MALPNQKRAKSRKRVRQYRLRLTKKQLGKCPKCGRAVMPHHICSFCGYYKNQEVIAPKVKNHKHTHKQEHKGHRKEEHDHDHNHEKEQKEKHEHKK